MIKIWCISDSHCKHKQLTIPEDIDIVIHAGDASNYRDLSQNDAEMHEFLLWFSKLPIKHKIYVPGNHDTSVEKGMHNFEDYGGIIVLINEEVTIEGIKIYGSPITPTFGVGWAYNSSHNKIHKYWDKIPDNTDILVTHGPAKGILDLTVNNGYYQCGCKTLLNKVLQIKPKYHIFGHIHDESLIYNAGIFKPTNISTTFINASVCNIKYNISNHGQIINYETAKK